MLNITMLVGFNHIVTHHLSLATYLPSQKAILHTHARARAHKEQNGAGKEQFLPIRPDIESVGQAAPD